MRKLVLTFIVTLLGGVMFCEPPMDSNDIDHRNQEKVLREAARELGIPAIKNFQEKKILKMILELRDQSNLITYVYDKDMHGKLHFRGKAIGYGLPYATQYTNPMQHSGYPQADPNGLFSPSSAEGTWILLINPETNKPMPVYIEERIYVSPFPLRYTE